MTAKSPDAHIACCLALTEVAPPALTPSSPDITFVIAASFHDSRLAGASTTTSHGAARSGGRLQRLPDLGEVVIAVADGVILEHELARERRIGVERHRRRPIELL